MAKQFLVSLAVASILLMAVGCADNNPISVANDPISGGDGGISIVALAKTAAVGDTSTDTVGVGVTVMFSAEIARLSLRDSIISSTWDFGDGYTKTCTEDSSICSVEHQYNTVGPYEVNLYVVLKGESTRNPWRRVYVVNTSLLPSVTAAHDSMFMYSSSEAIGTTGHWDVTFVVGVNSITAAAVRANVAVLRPFREGGRDNEWSVQTAMVSKTTDGKFYICKILDLTPGREYRLRLGLDVNNPSNTILSSSEFIRNRFYSTAYDVFEFSLKYNGQAVPKTTDYGVTAAHDSMFMYSSSEAIGTTGHWDVTFVVGVNSITAAAVRANVAVLRPFREGGRDNEWSVQTAMVSKTTDGKFYICKILDLTPGREYRLRLGLDVNNPSNTILSSSEFIRNRFYSTAYDVFEFSLKYNGQAVPKTTDYGTIVTPIDTSTVIPVDR